MTQWLFVLKASPISCASHHQFPMNFVVMQKAKKEIWVLCLAEHEGCVEANYFGGDTWFYIFAKHIFLQPLWENVKFGEWKNDCLYCIKETFISEKWNSWCFHTFEFWSQNMLFEHERGRDSVSKYLDQWSLNSKPYFWLDVYFKARDDLWLLGLLLFHPKNPWRIINFKDQ